MYVVYQFIAIERYVDSPYEGKYAEVNMYEFGVKLFRTIQLGGRCSPVIGPYSAYAVISSGGLSSAVSAPNMAIHD